MDNGIQAVSTVPSQPLSPRTQPMEQESDATKSTSVETNSALGRVAAKGAAKELANVSAEEAESAIEVAINTEQLQQVTHQLEKFMGGLDRDLEFSIDEESGQSVVQVMDKQSGELIRQIPSKEILEIVARLSEAVGLFDNNGATAKGLLLETKI